MLETHRAVRSFLFENAGIEKLAFNVYGGHELVLRQLSKTDGVFAEGVLRKHEWVEGLGWQDVHLFAMFKTTP